jgi:type IV pilus assembly protein PilC
MAAFTFKARDAAGEIATGILQAASLADAAATLRGQGKFVVSLDPAKGEAANGTSHADDTPAIGGGKRIKRADVITFAHQLAVMIDTGVPISEALACVAEQAPNPAFAKVVGEVAESVEAGGELSTALLAHPKVFPPVMTSLIKAAEASGTLASMLERISGYLAKEQATAKKIRGALTYPAVMLMMIFVVTGGLLVFVLPRFASIFNTRGATLPLPTRVLMGMSHTLQHHWLYWIIGTAIAVTATVLYLRTDHGRSTLDTLKLRVPILGPLFSKLYLTRASRTMGTMIAAGVPILDMVQIVRAVTPNRCYDRLWDKVDSTLKHGGQLSEGLQGSTLIPRSVRQMIASGEKAGRLAPVMEKIANYTELEFDEQVKTTTNMIEPIMVVTMGSIVGFVAIALLLPIFSIGTVVAG